MDIEVVKKIIKRYAAGHAEFVQKALTAERYYRNQTDVLLGPDKKPSHEEETENPLRNADNRIPFNFHGLLVNQKASYGYTYPPMFDVGSDKANTDLVKALGDDFPKTCKDLCIEASNASVGWIHVWKTRPEDEETEGAWQYAVVPAPQVIPIWSGSLKRKLLGVLRTYQELDTETGDNYIVYEYWNDVECYSYRLPIGETVDSLMPYYRFVVDPINMVNSNEYRHEVGEVPFFPFFNNNIDTGDLDNIKPLIDTYCKVFSGFVNDLEDIQEVIFVLTNYGGQDLNEFLTDLKYYKAIKTESDGTGDRSGVETLTIQLPVEARKELLTVTRACIFEQGMGIDPDPQNFGNSSGVALNFLYSLLELKMGLQETEFRKGFGRFIRCLCRLNGIAIKDDSFTQIWTRNAVRNELEQTQIAGQSGGIISKQTIVANHPWVDDLAKELQQLDEEEQEARAKWDEYQGSFGHGHDEDEDDDVNGDEE